MKGRGKNYKGFLVMFFVLFLSQASVRAEECGDLSAKGTGTGKGGGVTDTAKIAKEWAENRAKKAACGKAKEELAKDKAKKECPEGCTAYWKDDEDCSFPNPLPDGSANPKEEGKGPRWSDPGWQEACERFNKADFPDWTADQIAKACRSMRGQSTRFWHIASATAEISSNGKCVKNTQDDEEYLVPLEESDATGFEP